MTNEQFETMKHIGDGVAAVIAVASFASLIPSVAGLFTIIWTGMRIYEMVYGIPFSQSYLARWINRKG